MNTNKIKGFLKNFAINFSFVKRQTHLSKNNDVKFKEFLNKVCYDTLPNITKSDNIFIKEYPKLSDICSEVQLLKIITNFCKDSDEFYFAKQVKSNNHKHVKKVTTNQIKILTLTRDCKENDIYFTFLICATEDSLTSYVISVQQVKDYYEIKLEKSLQNNKNTHLKFNSFNDVRKKIMKDMLGKCGVTYILDMPSLQRMVNFENNNSFKEKYRQ